MRHSSPATASTDGTTTYPGGHEKETGREPRRVKLKSQKSASSVVDVATVNFDDQQEAAMSTGGSAAADWVRIGEPEGRTATASDDLNALARITQDILDAMAQKPSAQGGQYKELEELLKVGVGRFIVGEHIAPPACILTPGGRGGGSASCSAVPANL
jgi:hypothetical protein